MHALSYRRLALAFLCVAALQCGCDATPKKKASEANAVTPVQKDEPEAVDPAESDPAESDPDESSTEQDENVTSLFDGESFDGWEIIEFGGEGDVEIVDGEIRMQSGDPLTGICVTEDTELPKANYEVSLEAMKIEGSDFFCAITFPVNDTFCTLVVGGWGGSLVGLSNLDGQDASENGTKVTRKFEKNRWYAIRVQVLPERIIVWIDEEQFIDESIAGREVSIRNDVITTTPLGITNFITMSALRNIKIRKLDGE